ncbi:hypothetical protein [Lentzea sp. E54]|uniref:hypothetical protein n=1 Tax=Lentzea xerophila TaxID=3435883 RepID=UPI003DA6B61D
MSPSILQPILPAIFGFIGTILGALVARSGTSAQRRHEADAIARARIAAFTQAATRLMRRGRPDEELWETYLEAKDEARIALLTARVPLEMVNAVLWVSAENGFKDESWLRPHVERASAVLRMLELPPWRRARRARQLADQYRRSVS